MNALVDEFAASGDLGISAPFALVPGTAAVAIPAADKHQVAEGAGIENLASLPKGSMIAVIKADADPDAGSTGGCGDCIELGGAAGARLLDQDVLAGSSGLASDGCEQVVSHGDQNHIYIGAAHGGGPVGGRAASWRLVSESPCAIVDDITTDPERTIGEGGGALAAD